ncbi:MAG TPA: T9SS type A sorting domain-containing protein [Bacteroidales bacterium]|nr:T9SS type A sorting domain-containing protein [Bacteroidales bacterium]
MKKSASLISWLFSQHHISRAIVDRQKINRLLLPMFFIVLLLAFAGNAAGQIAFRATTTATTTTTTLTIAKPASLAVDDIMFVQIVQSDDGNTTLSAATGSGWTQIAESIIASYSTGWWPFTSYYRCHATLLYKIATAADVSVANFSFTLDSDAQDGEGAIVAFSGVDVATGPFDVAPGATYNNINDNQLNASTITTATANAAVIMFGALYDNQPLSVWTTTSPGGLTELYDLPFDCTRDIGMGAAWAVKPTTGATGGGTATISAACYNGSILIALKPPLCSGTPAPGNTISNANPVCPSGIFTLSLQNNIPLGGVTYQWQSSSDGSTWTNIAGGTSSTLTTSQTAATYYHCLVTCSGNTGTSNSLLVGMTTCSAYYHPTTGLNSSSCGSCMTLINTGAAHYYYDDGGPSGNYSNNINNDGSGIYRTFCPAEANQAVRATFAYLDTESGADILTITNGASGSTSLPTLWQGSGSSTPAVQTSTDVSGCLTFRFDSDGGTNYAGWEIILTTVPSTNRKPPINSDCQTATTICSASTITATSNGPGLYTTCPAGCLGSEYYTNWYVWKAGLAGTLRFSITPASGADDYDFALYKATDCSAMGNPVRCSFRTATGATGLSPTESDTEESATVGNGWVDTVHTKAEEYYFLMISDYTKEGTGFTLSFAGSDCNITCASPLPVELLTFDAKCDNDNVDLSWSTATETNNDYFTIERSADVADWEFVKSVPGAGNSNSTRFYSAIDKDPLSGTSYYRLKQTDFDGHSETFSPIAVICDDAGSDPQVNYSPNPFTSELWVDFQNLVFEKASVSVYDVQGNLVYQKNISYTDFPDKKLDMNLSNLAAGIYMVSFITEEFNNTHRIVKK